MVAADSCSGSFQPAESLYYMGLILIGVEVATTENGNASSEYDKYVKAVLK